MTFVFEALYLEDEAALAPEEANSKGGGIKMMDTILFGPNFQPLRWIFTDLLGRIQFKDIQSITINDVIRAFLVNLNEGKKNEFSNEDLMDFLASRNKANNICFALSGTERHFMHIADLCDIKSCFPRGLEALQLFKIPTREFLPFFYYHTLLFKEIAHTGEIILHAHAFTKLAHSFSELKGAQPKLNMEAYEEDVCEDELELFAD